MKYKELSEESIKPLATSDNSIAPKLTFIHNVKVAVKFEDCYLNQNITFFRRRNDMNFFQLIQEI